MRTSERRWAVLLVGVVGSMLMGLLTTLGLSASAGSAADPVVSVPGTQYSGGQTLAADPNGGYWTVDATGGITLHDGAPSFGSPAQSRLALSRPIVGMAATPDGGGYWLVGSDGGVFSYGDATFHGSTGDIRLNEPIVGMVATPDGGGYWLVAADGGVFSFGDAGFHGSTGAIHLNEPIVGMASTPDGAGYWLVASDGGIFTFGDASFYGSPGAIHLNEPVVGMASTPDGAGYWLVGSDGAVLSYGDASFSGSLAGTDANTLGIVVNPPQSDYALVSRSGSATYFGRRPGRSDGPSTTTTTADPPTTTTDPPTTTTDPPTTTTTDPPTTTTTDPPTTTTTTTTQPSSPPSSTLINGIYDDTQPTSITNGVPSGVSGFSAATGVPINLVRFYLNGEYNWADLTDAIAPWIGVTTQTNIAVPAPTTAVNDAGGISDFLVDCAAGDYNTDFENLAQNLIADGFSNSILSIFWEWDDGMVPADATDYTNFASCWNQAVPAMKSVPGAAFKFAWYDGLTYSYESWWSDCEPNWANVDYVTVDFYDQFWGSWPSGETFGAGWTEAQHDYAWNNGQLGILNQLASVAAQAGKPMGIGEWGIWSTDPGGAPSSDANYGGDDPYFVNDFTAWMKSHNVAWAVYFDWPPNVIEPANQAPLSEAAYAADLG